VRTFIARLIYQKWFYAFLAAVLWLHVYTDIEDALEVSSIREIIALVLSTSAALLVTVVFLDLHFRWPRKIG
jgi:ABC-type Co2+ transport system permease subunit